MQCPRCKKEIQDNSLKCDNCNAKIGSLCYNCNSYNLITALECSNCHAKLLKICSECGAANLPNATRCRKCDIEFVSQVHEEAFSVPIHFESMKSQQKVKERLVNALKDNKMIDRVIIKDEIFDIIAKATTDQGGRETTQIAERQIITELKNLLVNAKEGEKITVDKNFIQKMLGK